MDYNYYNRKINDVIMKCPIEAGVEILVYNLLDSVINPGYFSLIDINRLRKERDERLDTDSGIPDMAILSNDFEYQSDKGKVYGFVEVKATNNPCNETEQITGQKEKAKHYLYTNGLVWQYYLDGNKQWEVLLDSEKRKTIVSRKEVVIEETQFNTLVEKLVEIQWK